MKKEDISDALNQLDDDILDQVQAAREKTVSGRRFLLPAFAAACAIVAVGAALLMMKKSHGAGMGTVDTAASRPVLDLPMLTISEDGTSGMGFEGYLYFDPEEIDFGNPWREDMDLTTLPVYRNGSYNQAGFPVGLSEEEMLERLCTAAEKLDTELGEPEVIRAESSGLPLPQGTAYLVKAVSTDETMELSVEANGVVRVNMQTPKGLPNSVTLTGDGETQALDTLAYLTRLYADFLDFSQPQYVVWGDYNIYGEYGRVYQIYESGDSNEELILNYYFNTANLFGIEEGDQIGIARQATLEFAQKVGDYPLITADQAQELLLEGSYTSSVNYPITESSEIAYVELRYRCSATDAYWMPYYRFLVKLPEEWENGLCNYGAYYVPAVDAAYITNMPTYDGRFN